MRRVLLSGLLLTAALLVLGLWRGSGEPARGQGAPVARANGDCNGDGERNLTDAIFLLKWLFQGGPEPVPCFAEGASITGADIVDHSITEVDLRLSSLDILNTAGSARIGLRVLETGEGDVCTHGPNGSDNVRLCSLGGQSDHGYVAVYDAEGLKAGVYVDAAGRGGVDVRDDGGAKREFPWMGLATGLWTSGTIKALLGRRWRYYLMALATSRPKVPMAEPTCGSPMCLEIPIAATYLSMTMPRQSVRKCTPATGMGSWQPAMTEVKLRPSYVEMA